MHQLFNHSCLKALKSNYFIATFGFGVVLLLIDLLVDSVFFGNGTFLEQLISPTHEELFMRFLILSLFIIFGFLVTLHMERQKKLQEYLCISNQNLDEAQRIAHIGSWAYDYVNEELRISAELGRILDMEYASIYRGYEVLLKYFHQDDQNTLTQIFAEPVMGQHESIECRHIMKTGDVKMLHLRIDYEIGEEGKIIRSIGTAHDITTRRQMEKEDRSLRERYEEIFASSPAMIYTCRIENDNIIPTFASARLEQDWGYTPEEVLGNDKWWIDHVHPNDRKRLLHEFQANKDSRKIHNYDYRFGRKDNAYQWVRDSGLRIPGGKGKSDEIVGSWLIITELRESIEQANFVLDSIAEGIYGVNRSGECTFINKSAVKLLGFDSSSELIGTTIHECIHHTHIDGSPYPRQNCPIFRTIKTGSKSHVDNEVFWRKDGTRFPVSYRARSISTDDKTSGAVVTFLNITDTIKLHEALDRSNQELRSALTGAIETIAKAVEARDAYTAGHQRRVAIIACAIAKKLGLTKERIFGIHMGAIIHDIGKIQIPAELLAKPTKLTKIEYELIKVHTRAGYEILKHIHFPWPVAEIVYQHHERLDGTGYPQGLHGDEIILESRIVAVADVVEAMSSHRPYRPALGIDKALDEIRTHQGSWYDIDAANALFALASEKKLDLIVSGEV